MFWGFYFGEKMDLKIAKKILKTAIDKHGGLDDVNGEFVCWHLKRGKACLDGEFSADELIAIGIYINAMRSKDEMV